MPGLFDKLYDASEEAIKKLSKPLVVRKLKRKLEASYDDAETKIIEAEERLQKMRIDVDSYDVAAILTQKRAVEQAKKVQKEVAAEHKEMFGAAIKKEV